MKCTDSTVVKSADHAGQAAIVPFCASPRHGESPDQAGKAAFNPIQNTSICPRCGNSNVDMKRGHGSCDVCLNFWELKDENEYPRSAPKASAFLNRDEPSAVSVVNHPFSIRIESLAVCFWRKSVTSITELSQQVARSCITSIGNSGSTFRKSSTWVAEEYGGSGETSVLLII